MRSFVSRLAGIALFVVVVLATLEMAYTRIFQQWAQSEVGVASRMSEKKFDVLFLGSSRTRHHYDIELLENFSGGRLSAYNLGITGGAGLDEMIMLLRCFLVDNSVRVVVFEGFEFGDGTEPKCFRKFLPWYYSQEFKTYFDSYRSGPSLNAVPFLRYLRYPGYDWRYLLFSLARRDHISEGKGYVPLDGSGVSMYEAAPIDLDFGDDRLTAIRALAEEFEFEVLFVVSPVWQGSVRIENAEGWDVFDFSTYVADESLFRDSLHLNRAGTDFFTQLVWERILLQIPALEELLASED